jgi:hypothetical protein
MKRNTRYLIPLALFLAPMAVLYHSWPEPKEPGSIELNPSGVHVYSAPAHEVLLLHLGKTAATRRLGHGVISCNCEHHLDSDALETFRDFLARGYNAVWEGCP